jgi:hypothetical protein
MASGTVQNMAPVAGITTLPGLQVSPFGASITNVKVYNFTLSTGMTNFGTGTSTWVSSTGPVEFNYTVSGLTTNDIPAHLNPISGSIPAVGAATIVINSMRVSAANTLTLGWTRIGTTTGSALETATPVTLLTYSYYSQASSTST